MNSKKKRLSQPKFLLDFAESFLSFNASDGDRQFKISCSLRNVVQILFQLCKDFLLLLDRNEPFPVIQEAIPD